MKKFTTSILVLALSLGVFAQPNTWPSTLGNVSFATDSTWTISGNGIFQIWSDAVQTDSCSNRTEFDGGCGNIVIGYNFNIDCLSNPGQKGDLFSWQAVYELRYELCLYPWRVPTKQDFIDLDIAFGGTGRLRNGRIQFVTDNYINRWGGTYAGTSKKNTICGQVLLTGQGLFASYWSQSQSTHIVEREFRLKGQNLG